MEFQASEKQKQIIKEYADKLGKDPESLEKAYRESLSPHVEERFKDYPNLSFLSATQTDIHILTIKGYSALVGLDKADNDFNIMVKKGEFGVIGNRETSPEKIEEMLSSTNEGRFTMGVPHDDIMKAIHMLTDAIEKNIVNDSI
jgi:hypothetical protein